VTGPSDDAAAFERFLGGSTPEVAAVARAVRVAVLERFPDAIEWFDQGDGLLAIGATRSMKGLLFAIIPHRSHVNLQLVDGVELPNPFGKVEGTGKRARHIKVRSIEDAAAPWLTAAIDAQIAAFRARSTTYVTTGGPD
jgi:hypothetical protein